MSLFLPALAEEICQGDVFRNLIIPDALEQSGQTACAAVLLTNDCDIDKRNFKVLQVARVVICAETTGDARSILGDVQRGRVPAAMMLPDVPVIGDSFVDFRHIFRVPKSLILTASADGRRVASMTEDARTALFNLLHTFYRRRQAPRGNAERAPTVEVVRPRVSDAPPADEGSPELA